MTPSDTDPVVSDEEPAANPFEGALGQLVRRIRSGDLPQGTRLPPERELSEELGVSRTTLRSVIRSLQQAGYVRTQRGRSGGSFVIWESDEGQQRDHVWSASMKERLLDTLRFRSILEPGAASLAAASALDPAQQERLSQLLAAATTDGPGFRLADAELHSYIASLSGCTALVEAIGNVQLMLNESLLRVVPVMGPALHHSHEQHARIVEAILAGRVDEARAVMYEHVEATAELMRGFLH